jgi:hypothetical protein
MVAGDVVNGVSAAGFDFRPAATVECAITSFGNFNAWVSLTDGTADINCQQAIAQWTNGNVKYMITNSIWFRMRTSVDGSAFSGIQIK